MTTQLTPPAESVLSAHGLPFANHLIVAYPELNLVEVGYEWLTPDQVRSLVESIRYARKHPYRGIDREVFMSIEEITIESCDRDGYLYIEETPCTPEQVEGYEIEAIRAARTAEGIEVRTIENQTM